jgi:hypothetical protein
MTDGLDAAIRAARRRWRGSGSHLSEGGNPQTLKVGTEKAEPAQSPSAHVPTVPTDPTSTNRGRNFGRPPEVDNWEERAATLEFEGGIPRAEAEHLAREEIRTPKR